MEYTLSKWKRLKKLVDEQRERVDAMRELTELPIPRPENVGYDSPVEAIKNRRRHEEQAAILKDWEARFRAYEDELNRRLNLDQYGMESVVSQAIIAAAITMSRGAEILGIGVYDMRQLVKREQGEGK
jgi:hypothetical protein